MNEQLQQLHAILSQKGMINMPIEQFAQLPEEELMKYASVLQQGDNRPQMEDGDDYLPSFQVGGTSGVNPDVANIYGNLMSATGSTEGDEAFQGGNGFAWQDTAKGNAGQMAAGIGGTAGQFAGNLMKNPNKPGDARHVAGTVLSAAGQGAAMGSAFGP